MIFTVILVFLSSNFVLNVSINRGFICSNACLSDPRRLGSMSGREYGLDPLPPPPLVTLRTLHRKHGGPECMSSFHFNFCVLQNSALQPSRGKYSPVVGRRRRRVLSPLILAPWNLQLRWETELIIQGVFFQWYPPKKLKYGKPRLGESTLT